MVIFYMSLVDFYHGFLRPEGPKISVRTMFHVKTGAPVVEDLIGRDNPSVACPG